MLWIKISEDSLQHLVESPTQYWKGVPGKEASECIHTVSLYVGVYLGTCLAPIDCSSSVTVAWLTHIKGSGIRFWPSEKTTDTQLTVLP